MKSLRRTARAAFTLMEIMLVVMIIALLAGLAVMNMGDLFGDAQISAAKADMGTYKTVLLTYRGKTGNYPTSAQGLNVLVTGPDNQKGQWNPVMEKLKKDPWGKDYVYVYPGQKFPNRYDIYSAGKDGQPGTADDVWPD